MKKLLLILTLLFTLTSFSQESDKTQFTKNYSRAQFTNEQGEEGKWYNIQTRIIFNYTNDPSKIKMFLGNETFNFTQVEDTLLKSFPNEVKYYELHCKDDLTSEDVYIYYCIEQSYGVFISDGTGRVLWLFNPLE